MSAILDAFPTVPQGIDRERATADVLELARAWERGDLPLREVARLSTGAERYACRRAVGRDDPDHALLCRLFEALVPEIPSPQTGRVHVTPWGCFTEAELVAPWQFEQFINRVRVRFEREGW